MTLGPIHVCTPTALQSHWYEINAGKYLYKFSKYNSKSKNHLLGNVLGGVLGTLHAFPY